MSEQANQFYDVHDDSMCALDTSACSQEEQVWYTKLQERLGLPGIEQVIIYHAAMHMLKDSYMEREKMLRESFPKESPENRKVLLGILEKILEGESLPEF
jgi:hypothetical protein